MEDLQAWPAAAIFALKSRGGSDYNVSAQGPSRFSQGVPRLMKVKIDLKKVFYFSAALLILIAIAVFFIFFLSVRGIFLDKYFPNSKAGSAVVSVRDVYDDFWTWTMILAVSCIGLFILSFIYSLITYSLFIRKPYTIIKKGLKCVKDGDFETRLPVKGLAETALLIEEFNAMVKACQKKISIKHYVSDSTEKMLEHLDSGEITTQPRRKLVTIFFSDVRDFTSFSEQHDPLVVINTINELFDIQVAAIRRNAGDIDKFIGDEIMVEFPSPSAAFKAADEIQSKIAVYNRKRRFPLDVGIGVNFGEAVVGAIGSGGQFNWTTIGHTVNVARRLCGMAEPGEIVVSGSVYEKLKTKRACEESDIRVKGISKAVHVYTFCPRD
jgi:class 3 adenylate cyclase